MNKGSFAARYWRSLFGVNRTLGRPAFDGAFTSTESVGTGELILRKLLDVGYVGLPKFAGRQVSQRRSRTKISRRTPVPAKYPHLGALLYGVGYMLDFRGSRLSQATTPDPDAIIAEAWADILAEIEECLSADKRNREQE